MNHFLSRYVKKNSTLAEFVVQFSEALMRLFEREHLADHDCRTKTVDLVSIMPMEVTFRDHYTLYTFYKLQKEFKKLISMQSKVLIRDENRVIYLVREIGDERGYDVTYIRADNEVYCLCQMFESTGILCCHCLEVLKQESVLNIDRRYAKFKTHILC